MKLTDIKTLNESSLARVYSHFESDKPVALITAFRGENTYAENVSRNKELAASVRKAGFGFVYVDGAWIENKGEPNEVEVSEVSLLIVGDSGSDSKLYDLCVTASQKYNQDGFILKSGGKDSSTSIYDKTGKVVDTFNKLSFDKLADYFTKLRGGSHGGRSFTFESFRVRSDNGMIGRLIADRKKT